MFAEVAGAFLLVCGIGLALSSVGSVVVGTLSFAVLAVKVGLVAGLIYLAWRLIEGRSVLLKVLGAFLLVAGVGLAFPVAGAMVVGTFGAIGLAFKIVVTVLMIYLGWRWLKTGRFSLPGGGGFGRR